MTFTEQEWLKELKKRVIKEKMYFNCINTGMRRGDHTYTLRDKDYSKLIETVEEQQQEIERLEKENSMLEESRNILLKENDKYEKSYRIDDFMYEFNVNENGEIPCQIKIHGIEHTFGINKKCADDFSFLFRRSKVLLDREG